MVLLERITTNFLTTQSDGNKFDVNFKRFSSLISPEKKKVCIVLVKHVFEALASIRNNLSVRLFSKSKNRSCFCYLPSLARLF